MGVKIKSLLDGSYYALYFELWVLKIVISRQLFFLYKDCFWLKKDKVVTCKYNKEIVY